MVAPLISIVTPSYNQGRFIEAAMRSVLTQDYPCLEYLIVDGGSTDGTQAIVAKYESQLAFFRSRRDEGQADAINEGFRRSTGEYIAWLNSDDLYLPHAVREAVSALERHPKAALVYANGVGIDESGHPMSFSRHRQYSLVDLLSMRMLHQPTVFMRRRAAEAAGWLNSNYHCLLDHDLWLRMAVAGEIVYVDRYWACARSHPEAKNSRCAGAFGDEARRISQECSNRPDTSHLVTKHASRIDAGLTIFESTYLLNQNRSREALAGYVAAVRRDPAAAARVWRLATLALVQGLGLTTAAASLIKLKNLADRLRAAQRDDRCC